MPGGAFPPPRRLPGGAEGELDSYVAGIGRMYRRLYAYADARRNPGEAIVALGHLHATGAELSDDDRSERAIMGGLESVSADTFDAGIAYTALGHIHKAQRIGGREAVRYAGSPLPMSFSEKNYRHQVIAVEIEEGKVTEIEAIGIPRVADLMRIPDSPLPPEEVLRCLARASGAGGGQGGREPLALFGDTGPADGAGPYVPPSGRGGVGREGGPPHLHRSFVSPTGRGGRGAGLIV